MKLLIGYDGSESADDIFENLRNAGLPSDTDAIIVSVGDLLRTDLPVQAGYVSPVPTRRVATAIKQVEMDTARIIEETTELAEKGMIRAKEYFPGWQVSSKVLSGTPAWVLIDAAEKMKADLIVVGSQGRSALGRLFLGSVSKRVATDAKCSVRIARTGNRSKTDITPSRILVGVDGSPAAEQAIFSVGQRVWQEGTKVRLVTVDESIQPLRIASRLPQATAMINSYYQTQAKRISEMLDWGTEELNNIGLKASVVRLKGGPKSDLLREAEDWNADSIFVGTRDFKNAFERFQLGSVSTHMVTKAKCSVEVVRPTETSEE